MNNFLSGNMDEKQWEHARNELERLLLSGLMQDDWRIKQLSWIPENTRAFYRFFKLMKEEQTPRLIQWCNLCHKHGVMRSDISDLIDAWNTFAAREPTNTESTSTLVHCQ